MSPTPGEIKFNIFEETTLDNIRVGYISTERGFIQNVSVCDANSYAKQNPGTTFIFNNRDGVRYLSINEVNALTIADLVPKRSSSQGTCNPVVGLSEIDSAVGVNTIGSPVDNSEEYRTRVNFYGGGGVGAKGNPVIGSDGSLLAIDLESGGFGYKYPPFVQVEDDLDIGSGAVLRSVLCEVESVTQYFSNEEDFEEYQLCDELEDPGFGRRYTPEGNDMGSWNPTIYANTEKNPFRRELEQYQRFLSEITKPWWTTRKYTPLSVVSPQSRDRVKYDVTDKSYREYRKKLEGSLESAINRGEIWNDFMNAYAISPVPPSSVRGSDYATIPFTFEWEENFPYDGEYVFKGCADGAVKDFYLDNEKVTTLASFNQPPRKIKKFVKAGVHKIRLDLYNGSTERGASSTNREIFNTLSSIGSANRKLWKINPGAGRGSDFLNLYGVLPFDPQSVLQIENTTNQPPRAVFEKIGDKLVLKVVGSGRIKVNFEMNVDDNPNTAGVAAKEIRIKTDSSDLILSNNKNKQRVTLRGSGEFTAGKIYSIQVIGGAKGAGLPNVGRTKIGLKDGHGNDINAALKISNTTVISEPKNKVQTSRSRGISNYPNASTDSFAGNHIIIWERINFPEDGNYSIEVMADDNATIYIGNRDGGGAKEIGNGLIDINKGGDETIIRKRGFSSPGRSTGKSTYTRYFQKGSYRIRVELEQVSGKPLAQGNPMAIAMKITSGTPGQLNVVSGTPWNLNPMGIALTIDAPLPPIPQEPIARQEGRCPNNPIWSTRFPGSRERWWPVIDTLGRWSPFMDKYAISPVPPLAEKGTDSGGVVYRNSWKVNIPYEGYYGFKGTVDNRGRILIDGNEVLNAVDNFKNNNPKTRKIFLSKGIHSIDVEVENKEIQLRKKIEQKIFNTADWIGGSQQRTQQQPRTFTTDQNVTREEWVRVDDVYVPPGVNQARGGVGGIKISSNTSFHQWQEGTYYKGKKIRPGGDWNDTNPNNNYIEWDKDTRLTLGSYHGRRFGIAVYKKKVITTKVQSTSTIPAPPAGIGNISSNKNGVTYNGPALASYRSAKLGPLITPAFSGNADFKANLEGKSFILRWENVNFPIRGQYKIQTKADDYVKVRVDGIEVGVAKVFEGVITNTFNSDSGKKTIEVEIYNAPGNETSTFDTNPLVASVVISVDVDVSDGTESWKTNPMGISAILIPPPCPKEVKGQGIVCDVIVDDPGNSYASPPGDSYPVSLRLRSVEVENSGINYSCGIDQIQITPSNGAQLSYDCDTFGRISRVNILDPGFGFTTYPEITIISDTGVNAAFRPQFEVLRDPIVVDPNKLIQVVDLVGLQQTGYVEGRPYYGAVFYKDGIRYAGYYETPGKLVQVYDTLQESITGEVTTKPSAIIRQGTNIQSNDPRLNIPGTPENLI